MLLRTRLVLIFGLASALLAGTVAVPLWFLQSVPQADLARAEAEAQAAAWRTAVADAVTPDEILLARLAADPALRAALATDARSGQADRLLAGIQARNGLVRIDLLAADGRVLASSAGAAADRAMFDTTNLPARLREFGWRTSVEGGPDGTILIVLVAALDEGNLFASIALPPAPVLDVLKRTVPDGLFLVDRTGRLQASTTPDAWPGIERAWQASGDGPVTVSRAGHSARIQSVALLDTGQSRVATLVSVTDVTAAEQQRQLLFLLTGSLAVLVFAALLLGLYGFAKGALDPLTEITRVIRLMAAGDQAVGADVPDRRDEVGAIAGALEVFRTAMVTLSRTRTRDALRAAQQQLLIRHEMEVLASVLDEAERKQLLSARLPDGAGEDGGGGEGAAALAEAFRQMAARVVAQHARLSDLLAERSRDLLTVRKALDERAQLTRLRQELELARSLQLGSLPRVFPPFPGRTDFEIHAAIEPAREVGGDFYDFALIGGDRLAVMIGDASGKGVSAALFIAMARSILHSAMVRGASPAQALTLANGTLSVENDTMMFATVFAGVLDLQTGWLTYASAGHNPPYLVAASAVRALPGRPGIALGVAEDAEYEDEELAMPRGATLLLFTDGVTEAAAPDLALFGEAALEHMLAEAGGQPPEMVVQAIQSAVKGFAAGTEQADDITVLAARWLRPAGEQAPAAAAPALPVAAGR